MLWVDHWETSSFLGAEALVSATWRGLGENRSFREAPGLYLDPQDWNEEDWTNISPQQAEAIGGLIGVVALLMMTYSDGWLIAAECADRVEFWEGHFFFHSDDPEKLKAANSIIDDFKCKRWKK